MIVPVAIRAPGTVPSVCSAVLAVIVAVLFPASVAFAQPRLPPNISERYPITGEGRISPPTVDAPIHECAAVVSVSGFVPKAEIRVFANGGELIGADTPRHDPWTIKLTRALVLGDSITATQTVGDVMSRPSHDAVLVTAYPALTTPVEVPKIYECGRVVPVGNLIASTHVEVTDTNAAPVSAIGSDDTTGDWDPVVTSTLVVGHRLRAQQIACLDISAKTAKSVPSALLSVTAAPNPPPKLTMDQPVVGNDQVVIHNLLVGSAIELMYGATVVPDGLATAADNRADVPPIPPMTQIRARQKLCTPSLASDPVTATNKPVQLTLGSPICAGSRYVFVDHSTPGLNVVLLRGTAVIGYAGGKIGTLKMAVGAGVTLADGDVLTVVQYIKSSFGTFFSDPSNAVPVGCTGGANVITQHNDNQRTGVYATETVLTPAAVLARGMKQKWSQPVKGWVNGQPLYVRNVQFERGEANGLFITTLFTNTVYGLDADTGAEKWNTQLIDSDTQARGLTFGIDSTPVLDTTTQRLYVVFMTKNQDKDQADLPDSTKPKNDGKAHTYQDTDLKNLDTAFWVVALDYRNGHELARTLVKASSYRANGQPVVFEAKFQRQHPALLLDHGVLYVAFGSIAGSEWFLEYHGWVMAYRASDLAFQSSFNTSKNYAPSRKPFKWEDPDDASGIWEGGGGLAADRDGNVYFLAGNGTADIPNDKYGDTFVKLVPTGSALIPSAFRPSDHDLMSRNDADFGSGGALVIPGTDFVIGGGKPGTMYQLDRNTMQERDEFFAATNQTSPNRRDDTWNEGPHLHGSPTYWRGPQDRTGNLYVWGEKDKLRRYRFDVLTGTFNHSSDEGPVVALQDWKDADGMVHAVMPGGMISLSANGNRAGSGIVWATLPTTRDGPSPGRLYAFNAETLQPLWDGPFPTLGHWLPPTIADGKVFIGTSSDQVVCFELGEDNRPGQPWKPFQPIAVASAMTARMTETHWDEAPMTTLPTNTLKALTPPPDASRYAVIAATGTSRFIAKRNSWFCWLHRYHWANDKTMLDASVTTVGIDQKKERVSLTISHDGRWRASDGSRLEVTMVNHYTAPEDDGADWTLYAVTRSDASGMLGGVTYVQRVMTHGGVRPSKAPHSHDDKADVAFEAQYVLFKAPSP